MLIICKIIKIVNVIPKINVFRYAIQICCVLTQITQKWRKNGGKIEKNVLSARFAVASPSYRGSL